MAFLCFEPWHLQARRHGGTYRRFGILKAGLWLCLGAAAALAAAGLTPAAAQTASASGPPTVTRFSATTINMEPSGRRLRFDVLTWSDEAARSAAAAALEADDPRAALDELPTAGYVWPDGSPVGYAIKYAHRDTAGDGERLTFVTNKVLGSYDFGGWTVQGNPAAEDLGYSVVELDVGSGQGTASLSSPVAVDAAAGSVELDRSASTVMLFTDVHRLDLGY